MELRRVLFISSPGEGRSHSSSDPPTVIPGTGIDYPTRIDRKAAEIISSFTLDILGNSHVIKQLKSGIRKVATSDFPVLIEGETGSGKELVSRGIHETSPRKDAPFLVVNCGAISPELMESELLGHQKGAFTGATSQRRGAFEIAHGGTIFLDEIGELPLRLQPKLLRVLEQKEI